MRDKTILEILFKLPGEEVKSYPELINWIFETFPV